MNRVIVPARQATLAGGIDAFESFTNSGSALLNRGSESTAKLSMLAAADILLLNCRF
jgi:hypothetical protein